MFTRIRHYVAITSTKCHWQLCKRKCSGLVNETGNKYKPGQKVHGFTVEKVSVVPELNLTAVLLHHDRTLAQHLHIARDDSNNVFGVAFRTTPMDSTGVPHILEHTALCGSEKYPVRDPFFKMLTRSLNTFMNAFTASDWTMYAYSSQNIKDYQNLMSVFLDAAFFPKLRELDFMQEGWRLEHDDPNDPSSPIIFKGVVFNEMKGVFSNGPSLFVQKAQNLLLPSHTYSVISGGNPADIVSLTWQQLKDFHSTHYHPSNSRFYTYGSFPLEDHLQFINDNALVTFSQAPINTQVPSESRWSRPREASMSCMSDPMAPDPDRQTTISISYLLSDIQDVFESFVINLIGCLLVQGEMAPFYQSLIEPNIGSEYSPDTGCNVQTRDVTFAVGLHGIHHADTGRVKDLIEQTFKAVVRDGFDKTQIEAVLHKIELGLKHQTDKFGLNLGIGLLPSWNHDADVIKSLNINHLVQMFRGKLDSNPKYLQEKVEQYFVNNSHQLCLVMSPEDSYEVKRKDAEARQLEAIVNSLTDDSKQTIYKKGLELLSKQMASENLDCLPTVHIIDIPPKAESVQLETQLIDGSPVQFCIQPTNGVTYFNALIDISELPAKLIKYVPLFCTVLTSMGAGDYDYKKLSQQIDLKTGGLSASTHVTSDHSQTNSIEKGIRLSSYCLNHNIENMFSLWSDIFNRLDMSNTGRLRTLITMVASELASSITGSGHRYAMIHAASSVSPVAALTEQMDGMTQILTMKAIAESLDDGERLMEIIGAIQEISRYVLQNSHLRCSMNTNAEFKEQASKSAEEFLKNLSHTSCGSGYFYDNVTDFQASNSNTHFQLPFQVNYSARCMQTVPYTHSDFASLRVLAKVLSSKFLHREIREKGGAYGGGAIGNKAGLFTFFSYRDPNSERTLEAFENSVAWVDQGSFTDQDIEESKLSIFSEVDSPVPAGSQGLREFLYNINYSVFQKHRERLIAVSRDDLIRVNRMYLNKGARTTSTSLLGPENQTTKSQNWNIINKM